MAKGSGSGSGSSAPLIGSLAGGFLSQGAGIGAVGCKPEDKSFYCQSSRFIMIIKNILFFVLLLALVYYLFVNRKQFFGK
jgi:hypothetical protein